MKKFSNSEKLFFESTESLKKAIEADNSGNISKAIKLYNETISKARTSLELGMSSDKSEKLQQLISKSQIRVEELRSQSQENKGIEKIPLKSNKTNNIPNTMQNAILKERPNLTFKDVAGLESAKQALTEAVLLPIKIPGFFKGPTTPWKGILLFGPPGTGKSYLAKAIAGEANQSTYLTVSTSELTSKWLGESEKLIKSLFETARSVKPSVVFIDEIDSLMSSRNENDSESARRMKTEFLIQMDGVGINNNGIILIGATNYPWSLDPAIRRRFEKRVYIPLPDKEARYQLLTLKLKEAIHTLTNQEILQIAEITEGFSGADLNILIRDALMQPIREFQKSKYFIKQKGIDTNGIEKDNLWIPCSSITKGAIEISWDKLNPKELARPITKPIHFKLSLKKVKPSVSKNDIKQYINWTNEFGEDGK